MPDLAATVIAREKRQEASGAYTILTIGTQVSFAHLSSYTPSVGDIAVALRGIDGGLLVLGKLEPPGTAASSPWLSLPLTNGWTAYAGGWELPQYRRVGDEVQIRGFISGSGDLSPFALPVGYRPPLACSFTTVVYNVSSPLRIDITADGVSHLGGSVPAASQVSLSGIRFATTA